MDGQPLCLDSDYECPPLPRCDSPSSDSSESEGTRSGSASPVSSGLPTTPTPSPTAESYDVAAELKGQAVIRCKTIKPLVIVKRAVSPVPPPPQPVTSTSTLPAADECEEEDDDAWQDNDEYYAAHAGSFITLAPPLPPSLPASPSCESLPMSAALPSSRALHRESGIIPPYGLYQESLGSPHPSSPGQHPHPDARAPAAADRHLALPLPLVLARCRTEPEYGVCVRFMVPLTRLRLRLCLAPTAGVVARKNARPAQDAPPDGRADCVCAVWHAFPFFLAAFAFV
ncbi:hypothetical protein B0H14DRAFT_201607 [Mycena olivaceomarginata]|nr:hypothetical protein B0H14DRAFT_201607 [Mycena olivaceomarginata]